MLELVESRGDSSRRLIDERDKEQPDQGQGLRPREVMLEA